MKLPTRKRMPPQRELQTAGDATGRIVTRGKPLMKRGYARVSTEDQSTALQIAALQKAGCAKIYRDEGLSGATRNRPALKQCLAALQAGDTLVVWKIDRLARSLGDLVHMLDDLRARNIKFHSLTEAIDTTTPTGRASWQMIGVLAELERSLIVERTQAGLKSARARGVTLGPKRKLNLQTIRHARHSIDGGQPPSVVAEALGVSRSTLYRNLDRLAATEKDDEFAKKRARR